MLKKRTGRRWKNAFLTTPLSLLINPFYIIRNGLFQAISAVAPNLSGEILDFGCGSKPYASLFTGAVNYIGVDIETSGHNHSSSQVDIFYDGKTLPFPEQRFDVVVSFEVFEHLFNPDQMLSEIMRVLKPGGAFLLTIPFAWDEHETPYDFARYTSFGIKHILIRNGFEVTEVKKTGNYWLALCQMLIAYLVQHVFPKGTMGKLLQLAVIFPINVMALLINRLLPQHYDYFCNTVTLARKPNIDSSVRVDADPTRNF